jgi:prepilin-type N-terminal cleavage/methylation domain-containing protein
MIRRFLDEEGGFTFPEMLVTTMIMLVVMFALYSIFDMSLRIYAIGNDKVEATQNARLGLERMEREIRAAYQVNGRDSTGTQRYRFFNANGTTSAPPSAWPTSTQITIGNESDAAGASLDKITCPGTAGTTCEYITYKLTDDTSAAACTVAPCTLRRVNAASSTATAGDPVVEFVRPPVAGDASRYGLRFRYFKADGTEINPASPGTATQANIARVEIALQIEVDDSTQELVTDVELRNGG